MIFIKPAKRVLLKHQKKSMEATEHVCGIVRHTEVETQERHRGLTPDIPLSSKELSLGIRYREISKNRTEQLQTDPKGN